jgi:branched-chain amino acid transport system permease protein
MDLSTFFQQAINAISLGAIYALFALGYSLVFSILGVLNLAHSAIFMWGAFAGLLALDPLTAPIYVTILIISAVLAVCWYAAEVFLIQRLTVRVRVLEARRLVTLILRIFLLATFWWIGSIFYQAIIPGMALMITGISPWIAFVLAMLTGGVLSVLLEMIAFRPLRARNAARLSQLISSIGAALVLVNIAQFAFQAIYNRTEAYYPRDLVLLPGLPTDTMIIGDVRIAPIRIIILVIALLLMILLQYMVTRTRIGQQMRAVAFNQRIASLLGIDVARVFVITFFLAGIFGGAAGMLFGVTFSNITPYIGQTIALVGLTAIVLGGLGSIQGAVLGGLIVAFIQTFSVALGGSSYRDAIVFILLFLVLLVRPQGLLGQPEQNRA